MKVFVLRYQHVRDHDLTAHRTREGAERWMVELCRDYLRTLEGMPISLEDKVRLAMNDPARHDDLQDLWPQVTQNTESIVIEELELQD